MALCDCDIGTPFSLCCPISSPAPSLVLLHCRCTMISAVRLGQEQEQHWCCWRCPWLLFAAVCSCYFPDFSQTHQSEQIHTNILIITPTQNIHKSPQGRPSLAHIAYSLTEQPDHFSNASFWFKTPQSKQLHRGSVPKSDCYFSNPLPVGAGVTLW